MSLSPVYNLALARTVSHGFALRTAGRGRAIANGAVVTLRNGSRRRRRRRMRRRSGPGVVAGGGLNLGPRGLLGSQNEEEAPDLLALGGREGPSAAEEEPEQQWEREADHQDQARKP